jgi:chlorite dismutase
MTDNIFDFIGGDKGQWKVLKMNSVIGEPLEQISHIKIVKSSAIKSNEGLWALKGLISNIRYAEKEEKEKLISIQADLGRPEATNAALIPIRKSEAWWALAQDERRKIFETKSHHTQTGMKYLPAIARKLYHCRDIGEPFDFLTWFEFAPSNSDAFEELVYTLRKTEEWKYVDREIDIRLIRE